jgi:hypothetical protein
MLGFAPLSGLALDGLPAPTAYFVGPVVVTYDVAEEVYIY